MKFRFSGKSGLQLPLVSLGLWHNFGSEDPFDVARAMLLSFTAEELQAIQCAVSPRL